MPHCNYETYHTYTLDLGLKIISPNQVGITLSWLMYPLGAWVYMMTPGSVWKLKHPAYFTVVHPPPLDMSIFCYGISTFSTKCNKANSPFAFLSYSLLANQEHAITIDYNKPVARICKRGVTWTSDLYVCIHKHARIGPPEGMLPQEIFRKLWDRFRGHFGTEAEP